METVTVWWATLGDVLPAHLSLLNGVERARRARYLREPDRDRFTLGVAITRLAVGGRMGVEPARLPINRDCPDCGEQHGPPTVVDGPHLSVSHSGDRVVVAISPHGPVGVDVEADTGRIGGEISRHLLAPGEAGDHTGQDLLAYWTRKEALIKATGDGLRAPMAQIHVSPPGAAPRVLDWEGRPGLAERFAMRTLDPGPGYAACLAMLDHPASGPEVEERSAAELLRPANRP
ncbi:4'-phosphopantetheinyl transferase family protein [Spirillospora sp. CA-294931]|uniref:4'-phosphopantetheinyl transferase family protein n=1 Tax=Spirillospora sp. CA-294931 TaxID=3240042 RepID=UPI003D92B91B